MTSSSLAAARAAVFRGTLRAGATDAAAVRALQRLLQKLCFPIRADGVFDHLTEQAVRIMQAARDVSVDGAVNAETLDVIADAAACADLAATEPKRELWRWEPRAAVVPPGVYFGDRFPGAVALTFDDGPSPSFTPAILDVLGAAAVKATFYVQGVNAARWPALVRRTAELGHLIGNHSWDHPELAWLTTKAAAEQVTRTQATIRAIVGNVDCVVRPPYGSPFHSNCSPNIECWPAASEALGRASASVMMWHIDTLDWKYQGRPEAIVRRFRAELIRRGGGVVLMHDVHEQSLWALPGILEVIRDQRVAIVRDTEMFAFKNAAGDRVTEEI